MKPGEHEANKHALTCQCFSEAVRSIVDILSETGSRLQHNLGSILGSGTALESALANEDPLVQHRMRDILMACGSVSVALIGLAAALASEVQKPFEDLHRDISVDRASRMANLVQLRREHDTCSNALVDSLRNKDRLALDVQAAEREYKRQSAPPGGASWLKQRSGAPELAEQRLQKAMVSQAVGVEEHATCMEKFAVINSCVQHSEVEFSEVFGFVEYAIHQRLRTSLTHCAAAWESVEHAFSTMSGKFQAGARQIRPVLPISKAVPPAWASCKQDHQTDTAAKYMEALGSPVKLAGRPGPDGNGQNIDAPLDATLDVHTSASPVRRRHEPETEQSPQAEEQGREDGLPHRLDDLSHDGPEGVDRDRSAGYAEQKHSAPEREEEALDTSIQQLQESHGVCSLDSASTNHDGDTPGTNWKDSANHDRGALETCWRELEERQAAWREEHETREIQLLEKEEALRSLQAQLEGQQELLAERRRTLAIDQARRISLLEHELRAAVPEQADGQKRPASFLLNSKSLGSSDGFLLDAPVQVGQAEMDMQGEEAEGEEDAEDGAEADAIWEMDWATLGKSPASRRQRLSSGASSAGRPGQAAALQKQ